MDGSGERRRVRIARSMSVQFGVRAAGATPTGGDGHPAIVARSARFHFSVRIFLLDSSCFRGDESVRGLTAKLK